MTFKDQLAADVSEVFCNTDEFASTVTVSADCVDEFGWDCVIDTPKGSMTYDPNGDTQTIMRCLAEGSTVAMVAGGIEALRRDIVVTINDESWGIDLATSYWDDYIVRLGLVKRVIANHQEMEARGTV